MIGNFAEAIAGIFGGLLAAYSLRLPFYAQAFVAFIGIPAAFALQEFNTKSKVQNPVSEILRILKYSLVTNRRLCYNIIFLRYHRSRYINDGMVRAARIDEVGNPDLLLRCHLDRAQSDGGIVRPIF